MGSEHAGMSRRGFLRGATAVSAAAGTLGILDQLGGGITRAAAKTATAAPQEQYLVEGLEAILDDGVRVLIPPLYKYIITGRLKRDRTWTPAELKKAQAKLEKALAKAEQGRPRTAAGLTVVVAWGLPYFRTFIRPRLASDVWAGVWPRDVSGPSTTDAVLDAVSFPSDPGDLLLEDNELLVMIRSDSLVVLDDVKGKLFKDQAQDGYIGDIVDVTSERTGFVGRGFDKPSLAKQLALKAGVPGADRIPDRSQLMMGFTSTQAASLGPGNIANFETLPGLTSVRPGDYFSRGCAMHLSHLFEDLSLWFGHGYADRVQRMFSPRTTAGQGTVTLPNGVSEVSTREQVEADARKGLLGHNATLQQATRLAAEVVDRYGVRRPKGTPVPVREDFNTLDNPFSSSANPGRDRWSPQQNAPGLHFVVFVPSSGRFHIARRAMDGVLPDGTDLGVRRQDNGINGMLRTTHRQNFLVPPRAHRSFPLAELLTG
jgi:hypothetical protein